MVTKIKSILLIGGVWGLCFGGDPLTVRLSAICVLVSIVIEPLTQMIKDLTNAR